MAATMNEYEVEVQYVDGTGRIAAAISREVATEARRAGWIGRNLFEEKRAEAVHAVKVYRID
jgi:hypothetical protein